MPICFHQTIKFFIFYCYGIDDLNLIGIVENPIKTTNYLKNKFEMKDLGNYFFCFGLQIEHFSNGIIVYQVTYTEKVLKHFYKNNDHPLSN